MSNLIGTLPYWHLIGRVGIEMIPAYSPEARGRSERAFGTHQGRLPKELALYRITTMEAANRYLAEVYLPAFNDLRTCLLFRSVSSVCSRRSRLTINVPSKAVARG